MKSQRVPLALSQPPTRKSDRFAKPRGAAIHVPQIGAILVLCDATASLWPNMCVSRSLGTPLPSFVHQLDESSNTVRGGKVLPHCLLGLSDRNGSLGQRRPRGEDEAKSMQILPRIWGAGAAAAPCSHHTNRIGDRDANYRRRRAADLVYVRSACVVKD